MVSTPGYNPSKFLNMDNSASTFQEILRKINLCLDNELPHEAKTELLKAIDENPTYKDLWQQEESFRNFLKTNIPRHKPPTVFLESLKEQIKNEQPG